VTSPLLFLDVDGVLNPFPDCPPGFTEYDFFPEDDEPVRLAALHVGWLRELAAVFDIVWASGWGEDANRLLSPFFNLPELPLVTLPPIPFEPHEKVPGIAVFAGDRPAAWVDDNVTRSAGVGRAAQTFHTARRGALGKGSRASRRRRATRMARGLSRTDEAPSERR